MRAAQIQWDPLAPHQAVFSLPPVSKAPEVAEPPPLEHSRYYHIFKSVSQIDSYPVKNEEALPSPQSKVLTLHFLLENWPLPWETDSGNVHFLQRKCHLHPEELVWICGPNMEIPSNLTSVYFMKPVLFLNKSHLEQQPPNPGEGYTRLNSVPVFITVSC